MVYINGGSKVSLQYTVVVLKILEEFVKEKPNTSRSLSVSFQKNLTIILIKISNQKFDE